MSRSIRDGDIVVISSNGSSSDQRYIIDHVINTGTDIFIHIYQEDNPSVRKLLIKDSSGSKLYQDNTIYNIRYERGPEPDGNDGTDKIPILLLGSYEYDETAIPFHSLNELRECMMKIFHTIETEIPESDVRNQDVYYFTPVSNEEAIISEILSSVRNFMEARSSGFPEEDYAYHKVLNDVKDMIMSGLREGDGDIIDNMKIIFRPMGCGTAPMVKAARKG